MYPDAVFSYGDKKEVFVETNLDVGDGRFSLDGRTYFLSPKGDGRYEIRALSKTNSPTVLSKIKLKDVARRPVDDDSEEFKRDLV